MGRPLAPRAEVLDRARPGPGRRTPARPGSSTTRPTSGLSAATSQRASASRSGGAPSGKRWQHRRHARLDGLGRLEELAPLVDVGRPGVRRAALPHHHRGRQLRHRFPQGGDLGIRLGQLGSDRRGNAARSSATARLGPLGGRDEGDRLDLGGQARGRTGGRGRWSPRPGTGRWSSGGCQSWCSVRTSLSIPDPPIGSLSWKTAACGCRPSA